MEDCKQRSHIVGVRRCSRREQSGDLSAAVKRAAETAQQYIGEGRKALVVSVSGVA